MKSALLVDNDPPICELLQEILKSEGMEAVTLANGSEAADYARSQKFDVVFVDSSSPVSDGIELSDLLRPSILNVIPLRFGHSLSSLCRNMACYR